MKDIYKTIYELLYSIFLQLNSTFNGKEFDKSNNNKETLYSFNWLVDFFL